jgi:hypothetical protein
MAKPHRVALENVVMRARSPARMTTRPLAARRETMSWISLAAVLICLLSACAPNALADQARSSPLPLDTPTSSLTPADEEIWGLWRRGAHSRSLESLGCQACHPADAQGGTASQIAWRNPDTGEPETMTDSRELCGNCHPEALDMLHASKGFHATLQCTLCHDPHRLNADCTSSGCHPSVSADLEVIASLAVEPGHETTEPHHCGGSSCHAVATQVARSGSLQHIGIQHAYLTCAACHDTAGMEVGPDPQGFGWNTWLPGAGSEGRRPFFSHNLQRQVGCECCHFEANRWELPYPVTNDKP